MDLKKNELNFSTVSSNDGQTDDRVLGKPSCCSVDCFESAENYEQTQEVHGLYRRTI